jgi:AcrR family transcriptional regulator
MAVSGRRLAPEVRRQQLLGVAIELFADRPYEAVGLEEVAGRAGVRRSLLYRYFPAGKPDLFLAAVEEAWRRLLGLLDTNPTRDLESKMPANVALFVGLADRDEPALWMLHRARYVDEPRVREVTRQARRAWARTIASNHLETADPPEPVLAAITGYLAFAEVLLEEWRLHETIDRTDVERMLEAALPPLIASSR